jgi:hypothetical protein
LSFNEKINFLYLLFPILLFRAAGSEILFCSSWVGQIPSPSSPRVGFSSCFCVAGLGSLSRSVVAQDSVFAAKSFPCRHRSGKGLGASKSPMGVFFSKLLNQTSVLPRFLVLPTGFGPSFLTDFLGSD